MRNKLVFLGLISFFVAKPSIGCMSDVYGYRGCHGKIHPVTCNCACDRIIEKRGLCLLCGHVGHPQRGLWNDLQLNLFYVE